MGDDTIDESVLVEIFELGGDDPSIAIELLDEFETEARLRLTELEQARATGDLTAIARIAHSLRGSAANFGAQRLVTLTADLEDAAVRGDRERVPELVTEIDAEFAAVVRALARITEAARQGRPPTAQS